MCNKDDKVEEIGADDNPCYLQQLHVNFKIYNPKVKPLNIEKDTFNPLFMKRCQIGKERYYLVLKAEVELASEET